MNSTQPPPLRTLSLYNNITLFPPLLSTEKNHNSYGRFKGNTMFQRCCRFSRRTVYPMASWSLKNISQQRKQWLWWIHVEACSVLSACRSWKLLFTVTINKLKISITPICNLVCLFSSKTHIKYICLIKPPGKRRTTFIYQMRVPLVGNLCIRTYVREKIRNGNVCLQFASCQGESVAEKVTVHYGYCTAFTQQRCLCLACMTFVCLKL